MSGYSAFKKSCSTREFLHSSAAHAAAISLPPAASSKELWKHSRSYHLHKTSFGGLAHISSSWIEAGRRQSAQYCLQQPFCFYAAAHHALAKSSVLSAPSRQIRLRRSPSISR